MTSECLSPLERDALVTECLPQVKRLAHRLASRLPAHVEQEDLIQAGLIGLLDALEKFDRGRGVRFWTYAETRIRGAMLDSLRGLDWVPRSVRRKRREIEAALSRLEASLGRAATSDELAAALGVDAEGLGKLLDMVHGPEIGLRPAAGVEDNIEFLVDGEAPDPYVQVERGEMKQHLAAAIENLPARERMVVTLYYHEELTMKEVGELLGVNESRVSQIHSKAVLHLRSHLLERLGPSAPRVTAAPSARSESVA